MQPQYGLLMPGESIELRLWVEVEDKTARMLAQGERELEDMLVVHVEGGNDIFISVTGEYLTSAFGASLLQLLKLQGPARFKFPSRPSNPQP